MTSRKKKKIQNKTKKKCHNKTKRIFTKKDFASGDGFLVSVWGPVAWTFLHTVSFNYPLNPTAEDKKHYRDYMLNLVNKYDYLVLNVLQNDFSIKLYQSLPVAQK